MNQLLLEAGSECLSKSFLTAAVWFRKGFVWNNNYVKLSHLCRNMAYRDGCECALEKQLITFPFLAVVSGGSGMGEG